jgi:hypothetical protein
MKKIVLLLLILLTLNSCSVGNDGPDYHYEVLPVDSYIVPQSFTLGETYQIKVKYKRPSSCHYFQGFYYEKDGYTRTIAVQTSVLEDDDCVPLDEEPVEASFNFQCTTTSPYLFKFYKGEDAEGNNIFDEVEIPVY